MAYISSMLYEHDTFSGFLKSTLESKAKANAHYSLRAFAKKLGLSSGGLSLVLNGKKRLSVERAHSVAQALDLNDQETEYLLALVHLEGAKSELLKLKYLERLKELNPKLNQVKSLKETMLTLEHFKLISQWYGLAVLELITVVPGKWTTQAIARKLGLSKLETENTLSRLEKLDLIERDSENSYCRVAGTVMLYNKISNDAVRNYYTDVHHKSLESLTKQTAEMKAIGAQVFAFDPDQLDDARAILDQYLNQLNELSKKGKNRTEVYQAFTNIFRLTEQETI